MIEIEIDLESSRELLDQLTAGLLDRETLHGAAALAVEGHWRQYILDRYVPRDREGVDFWADVASSMEREVDADGAAVTVNQLGLRLRYYGGTVTPGKSISSYTGELTRALSIPTERVPAKKGRQVRPAEAGPLAFIQAIEGDVIGYLFAGEVTGTIWRGRNKGKPRVRRDGPLMYVLKRSQTTRPDPDIIPEDEELKRAATSALLDLLTGG